MPPRSQGSPWPSSSSPGQGRAEVLLAGQGHRATGTSVPGLTGTPRPWEQSSALRAFVPDTQGRGRPGEAARAGTRGSCPCLPHMACREKPGLSHHRRPTGTLAEELPPQSCCGRALAAQWISHPPFSHLLYSLPLCAIWVCIIAEQVGSQPQDEFTNTYGQFLNLFSRLLSISETGTDGNCIRRRVQSLSSPHPARGHEWLSYRRR